MRAIAGTGNATTELAIARLLRQEGLSGWRRHLSLPGRPDFAWRRARVAVFVDGCFWHGCPRCYRPPKRNKAFWRLKVLVNRERDSIVSAKLRASGWSVLRIWECEVGLAGTVRRLRRELGSTKSGPSKGLRRK